MSKQYIFSIADIKIALKYPRDCTITEEFYPFQEDGEGTYQVEFKEAKSLSKEPENIVYKARSFCVCKEEGFIRYFYDGLNQEFLYAIGNYEWNNKKIRIEYIPYGYPFINETRNSFFHIAWEALLLNEERMILHSSSINTELGGILFSGISGSGKSTQAELWCKYEGARLINGDRTILCPTENGWLGYGSPYAGSSKCYRNEKCSLRAIVFLKKTERNSIRKMRAGEAFRKIYSCMTINSWDEEFVEKACRFVEKLVQEMPVYELSCTPDKEAVQCLKSRLLEDMGNGTE